MPRVRAGSREVLRKETPEWCAGFVTIAVSFCLVLAVGVTGVDQLFAQGEAKKDAPAAKPDVAQGTTKPDASKPDASKTTPATAKPDDTKKEAAKPAEPPLPPIPPAVQAKLEAARKAVAELIVAAQDAGLVETSIDPPPILDILIKGRAIDVRTLKDTTAKKPYGVSPEVFGTWFTGYGKMDGVNYAEDVRNRQSQPRAQGMVRRAGAYLRAVHPGYPQSQGPSAGRHQGRTQAGRHDQARSCTCNCTAPATKPAEPTKKG